MSKKPKIQIVHDVNDIPQFANEDEEHVFWETHEFGDDLLENVPPEDQPELTLPPRNKTRSTPITIRFDDYMVARVKDVAEHLGVRYQTLVKSFVAERVLQEEERLGIVPVLENEDSREPARRL